jgi:hypothetical protein
VAIDLLVACTKRKRGDGSPELSFRTLCPTAAAGLAETWWSRAVGSTDCRTMYELYSGVGWASSQGAYVAAQREDVCKLFVLSAGFGLLDEQDRVPIYTATFVSEKDQVARCITETGTPAERHRLWWRAINSVRGLGETPLSTRLELGNRCLIALGVHYLQACADDLVLLARKRRPGDLVIICVGANLAELDPALRECLLPLDLRIENLLGGPRSTLNQRTLEWLLTSVVPQTGWERGALNLYISNVLASTPYRDAPLRRTVSDQEVAAWIGAKLAQEPALTISQMLVLFRQNDTACEQGRFSRVVWTVRRNLQEAVAS